MKKLDVIVGKRGVTINSNLLDIQDCWDNLEAIKDVHRQKLEIYQQIDDTDEGLPELAAKITQLEFELQELWGFPQDIRFHRFWETPTCECPKMDNSDAYPSGYYSVAANCPLHGDE